MEFLYFNRNIVLSHPSIYGLSLPGLLLEDEDTIPVMVYVPLIL